MNLKQIFELTATVEKPVEQETQEDSGFFKNTLITISERIIRTLGSSYKEAILGEESKNPRGTFTALIGGYFLSAPAEFRNMKVHDETTRKDMIKKVSADIEDIKIKNPQKDENKEKFRIECNRIIEDVLSVSSLNEIIQVGEDLRTIYNSMVAKIKKELGSSVEKNKFLFRNVTTGLGETMSVFNIIEKHKVPSKKVEGSTYYIKHPNDSGGKNTFPDFIFHLEDDEAGRALREVFHVRKDVNEFNVESKMGRIVGKQTGEATLRKALGDDFFDKIFRVPLKKQIEISQDDLRKLMKAFEVQFRIPTVYVDVRKPRAPVKVFRIDRTPSGNLTYMKTTPGQLAILQDGKKIFGVELARAARERNDV